MQKTTKLAPIAIIVYLFHGIVLTPVMSDFVTFGENFKDFFPISVFQNTEILDYSAGSWFAWLLYGVINIGLLVVAIVSFVSKSKVTTPTPSEWGVSSAAVVSQATPPPPPN